MDDKELLVLAAKAAGYDYARHGGYIVVDGIPRNWNPLTDDGDALRLAVKLRMKVYPGEAYGWDGAIVDYSHKFSGVCDETEDPDPYAATRRAIVRAAVEIGKASSNAKLTGGGAND